MKIPSEVWIGSSKYTVKFTNETLSIDGAVCRATIDYNFHEIKINNTLEDNQGQEITFLHELFHGMIRERNIDMSDDKFDEETLVEELARSLHQVILDNPVIFC